MITLHLSPEDAHFLRRQLVHQARHVEAELVRTDKHELQHALALDLDHIQRLVQELDHRLSSLHEARR